MASNGGDARSTLGSTSAARRHQKPRLPSTRTTLAHDVEIVGQFDALAAQVHVLSRHVFN
jgi:hypothetical protein